MYLHSGWLEEAVETFERVMTIDHSLDDFWSLGIGLANLGHACQRLDGSDEALEHLRNKLKILNADLRCLDACQDSPLRRT